MDWARASADSHSATRAARWTACSAATRRACSSQRACSSSAALLKRCHSAPDSSRPALTAFHCRRRSRSWRATLGRSFDDFSASTWLTSASWIPAFAQRRQSSASRSSRSRVDRAASDVRSSAAIASGGAPLVDSPRAAAAGLRLEHRLQVADGLIDVAHRRVGLGRHGRGPRGQGLPRLQPMIADLGRVGLPRPPPFGERVGDPTDPGAQLGVDLQRRGQRLPLALEHRPGALRLVERGIGRDQRFDPADQRDDVVVDRGGAGAGGGAAPRLLAGVGEAARPAAVVTAGERREGAPFGQQPGEVRVEILGILGGAGDERFPRLDAGGPRRAFGGGGGFGLLDGVEAGALDGDAAGEPRRVVGAAGVAGERGELGFQAIELGPGTRRIRGVLEGVDALGQQARGGGRPLPPWRAHRRRAGRGRG